MKIRLYNEYDNNLDEKIPLNIQPNASIINIFTRLSYKPWYAIAEFVDNSTQSYLNNSHLFDTDDIENLVVKINYNSEENCLTIEDNAYGMEIEDFKRAIILDSRHSEQKGRNEFGMGLKTAASWFGNRWSVISTQYKSNNQYSAMIDIDDIKKNNINQISIVKDSAKYLEHGTLIKIEKVSKKVKSPATQVKIKKVLSSMYRRDINSGHIQIYFNDVPIEFSEYPILKYKGEIWKKTIDFNFEFEGENYHINGFVGIMDPGSFPRTGFALFRRDRVVIGGDDLNYKPQRIFGQLQSQISLKLFGEINMNEFPVNQAKDGFVWDNGLEDAFVEKLKENIQDYIVIASMARKVRVAEEEFSDENSATVEASTTLTIAKIADEIKNDEGSLPKGDILSVLDTNYSSTNEIEQNNEHIQEHEQVKIVSKTRNYLIPINKMVNRKVSIMWSISNSGRWFDVVNNNDTMEISINIDHPFFKPYSRDNEFKIVLEKFVLAFVIAEEQAKISANENGYIIASSIRNNMNDILKKMEQD